MSQFFVNANATPTPPVETILVDKGGSVSGNTIELYANSGMATLSGASVNFIARSPTEIDLDLTDLLDNVFLGRADGNETLTGIRNVSIGPGALEFLTTGSQNIMMGYLGGDEITIGNNNSGYGFDVLGQLKTGSFNSVFGTQSGNAYTGSESSNILIMNSGVVGESNVMRLGTQGSAPTQVNQTFIAGVLNTVSGRVVNTTLPGVFPYTMLLTDHVIYVNTSTTANTINLISAPVKGTLVIIKDISANAASNNITINGNGSNIVGTTSAATYVISSNGGSAELIYSGTAWGLV